jgi:hypothetical protein
MHTLRGRANVKETLLLLAFSMINVAHPFKSSATHVNVDWTLRKIENTNSTVVAARA